MSKDRVRFQLFKPSLPQPHPGQIQAAKEAFRLTHDEVGRFANKPYPRIQCRPSQFARFLILRNAYGAPNYFQDLDAVLIPEEPERFKYIDVAGRVR